MLSPLNISVQVRESLQEAKVGFALWKSNKHIADALAGKTDIDILVKIQDRLKFRTALQHLKAIQVLSQPWARYPNVEDWLAFDSATGDFLHLHAHFDMVTGMKRVKHLRLPWIDTVFSNLRLENRSGWPIPTAEMELLILLVRIWAKMPPWRRILAPKIPSRVLEELRWLEREAESVQLANLMPLLGLAADIKLPLGNDNAIVALARELYSQVRQNYRMTWRAALIIAARHNLRLALTRIWLRQIGPIRYRKTLPNGGAMIAFIGSDGSGKSAVSQSLERWLRPKLDVHLMYMGSGDGRAGWINTFRRQLSVQFGNSKKSRSSRNGTDRPKLSSMAEKSYRLFHLLLLRRKLKLLRLARRLANGGSIILLDRYPQSQFEAISDGPKLQHDRSFAWAARSERKLLAEAATLGPDLVIKLQIDPETAMLRKPDHNFDAIRRKCEVTAALQFARASVSVINAGQDLETVLKIAQKTIWEHLEKAGPQ